MEPVLDHAPPPHLVQVLHHQPPPARHRLERPHRRPLLPLAVFAYLFVIDPKMAGAETVAGWSFFLEHAMSFARTLFIAVFMYCIRAGGQLGPNGYGPEFGDSGDPVVAASVSLDRKRDSTVPQHRYTVVRENDSGWGQRRRPAGFGRR